MLLMKVSNMFMLMPGKAGRKDALRLGLVVKDTGSCKPWKKKRKYLAKLRKWLKKRQRQRLALSTQQLARKSAVRLKENN